MKDPSESPYFPNEALRIPLSVRLDGRAPWVWGRMPEGHLCQAARLLEMREESVVDNLSVWVKQEGWEIDLKDPRARTLSEETQVAIANSVHGDGQAPWLEGEVPLGHILRTAKRLACTPAEARALISGEAYLPPLALDVAKRWVGSRDLLALSQHFDGCPPWWEGVPPIPHVVQLATELSAPLTLAVSVLRAWHQGAPEMVRMERAARDFEATLDRTWDARLLSVNLDRRPPWRHVFELGDIVAIAATLQWPIVAVQQRVARFAALGIPAPELFAGPTTWEVPRASDAVILSVHLDGRSPWLGREIEVAHVHRAAARLACSPQDVEHRLCELWAMQTHRSLRFLEVEPEVADLEATLRRVLSERLDGDPPYLDGPLPYLHLARASAALGCSLGALWRILDQRNPPGVKPRRVSEPEVIVRPADLPFLEALLGADDEDDRSPGGPGRPSCWEIGARLVRLSVWRQSMIGEQHGALARFVGVGFDLPALHDAQAGHRFDLVDVELLRLSRSPLRGSSSGVVGARDLLFLADALEATLSETMHRIRRLSSAGTGLAVHATRSPDLGCARACPELMATEIWADATLDDARLRAFGRAIGALVWQGLGAEEAVAAFRSLLRLGSPAARTAEPWLDLLEGWSSWELVALWAYSTLEEDTLGSVDVLDLCAMVPATVDWVLQHRWVVEAFGLPPCRLAVDLAPRDAFRVLGHGGDAKPPWRTGRLGPLDVQEIAALSEVEVDEVLWYIRLWEWAGWPIELDWELAD